MNLCVRISCDRIWWKQFSVKRIRRNRQTWQNVDWLVMITKPHYANEQLLHSFGVIAQTDNQLWKKILSLVKMPLLPLQVAATPRTPIALPLVSAALPAAMSTLTRTKPNWHPLQINKTYIKHVLIREVSLKTSRIIIVISLLYALTGSTITQIKTWHANKKQNHKMYKYYWNY